MRYSKAILGAHRMEREDNVRAEGQCLGLTVAKRQLMFGPIGLEGVSMLPFRAGRE